MPSVTSLYLCPCSQGPLRPRVRGHHRVYVACYDHTPLPPFILLLEESLMSEMLLAPVLQPILKVCLSQEAKPGGVPQVAR